MIEGYSQERVGATLSSTCADPENPVKGVPDNALVLVINVIHKGPYVRTSFGGGGGGGVRTRISKINL